MASPKFDLFISHASEDKAELVYPLATALLAAGLRVWYDEFSLRLGDNLRQSIDKGLAQARYGVIVLSKAFFQKQWPQWELDGLLQRQLDGRKVILPVWHQVKAAGVRRYSLSLANLKGVTTDGGLGPVIDQILDAVTPYASTRQRSSRSKSAASAAAHPSSSPVTRLFKPIRRIEPYHLQYASALQSNSDASVQSVLRKHPEMLFLASPGRDSLVHTCFEFGQGVVFDAVELSDMQIIRVTLVTLSPVSEPPFDAAGVWSSNFATAVGRIATAKRWIVNNRDKFHRSLVQVFRTEGGSGRLFEGFRRMSAARDYSFIRTHFLILAGRRAAINEHQRQSFHESFSHTTLLSYDSILHSLVREDLSLDLTMPVLIKEVAIQPGQELEVSIKDWPLDNVLTTLDQSLEPLPAGARRDISAIEIALSGEWKSPRYDSSYAHEPDDANKMEMCVNEGGGPWTHPARWSEWIFSKARFDGDNRTFKRVFRIVCKAPKLRFPQTLRFVVKSVEYKEHRPELQAWATDDERLSSFSRRLTGH
jgi:hypothetical protein